MLIFDLMLTADLIILATGEFIALASLACRLKVKRICMGEWMYRPTFF
jgi:hypothetical protein